MGKQRFLIVLAAFCLVTNAFAKNADNPFAKVASVDIGSDASWVIKDNTATRSGSDSGTYYHLVYDKKQIHLRITSSAEDSEASAKKYDQFAVNDVLIDGKRLPVFQWCLGNQQRHNRFLQQGLTVEKDVCKNQGEVGAFSMKINVATLDMLKSGSKLTFELKPFRSKVNVIFDVSDFPYVIAELNSPPVLSQAVEVIENPVPVVETAAVITPKKCKASPPTGFAEIKTIEYNCANAEAKEKAVSDVNAEVSNERERRKKVAAEREKEKLAEKKVTKEVPKKATKKKLSAEEAALAAALAASAAKQQAIDNEITNKMLGVCQKKWEKGEHRCYCEKYIDHAPKEIQESSTCGS